jgi:hypothetical protein
MNDDMDQIGQKVFSKRTAALLLFGALAVKYYRVLIAVSVLSVLYFCFWNARAVQ